MFLEGGCHFESRKFLLLKQPGFKLFNDRRLFSCTKGQNEVGVGPHLAYELPVYSTL